MSPRPHIFPSLIGTIRDLKPGQRITVQHPANSVRALVTRVKHEFADTPRVYHTHIKAIGVEIHREN